VIMEEPYQGGCREIESSLIGRSGPDSSCHWLSSGIEPFGMMKDILRDNPP
jgi:hypothetical protein